MLRRHLVLKYLVCFCIEDLGRVLMAVPQSHCDEHSPSGSTYQYMDEAMLRCKTGECAAEPPRLARCVQHASV